MGESIPTQPGDVLILSTDQSFTVYAVGLVTKDGQQEFDTQMNVKYDRARETAMADAKALLAPGRRIFFRNIDTGEWCEILDEGMWDKPSNRHVLRGGRART
jgi:hypothetical protein